MSGVPLCGNPWQRLPGKHENEMRRAGQEGYTRRASVVGPQRVVIDFVQSSVLQQHAVFSSSEGCVLSYSSDSGELRLRGTLNPRRELS